MIGQTSSLSHSEQMNLDFFFLVGSQLVTWLPTVVSVLCSTKLRQSRPAIKPRRRCRSLFFLSMRICRQVLIKPLHRHFSLHRQPLYRGSRSLLRLLLGIWGWAAPSHFLLFSPLKGCWLVLQYLDRLKTLQSGAFEWDLKSKQSGCVGRVKL